MKNLVKQTIAKEKNVEIVATVMCEETNVVNKATFSLDTVREMIKDVEYFVKVDGEVFNRYNVNKFEVEQMIEVFADLLGTSRKKALAKIEFNQYE